MNLSLDCSTQKIGYAVFNEDELIAYGLIEPQKGKVDFRERLETMLPELEEIIDKYSIDSVIMEDVPKTVRSAIAIYTLCFVQGAIYTLLHTGYRLPIEFIPPTTWRKDIGISKGSDKTRDAKKVLSIQKANELFGLELPIEYTSGGNFKETGSDDISDAILLGASKLNKYKYKGFGRPTRKVGGR